MSHPKYTAILFNIERGSCVDGPGLRTTVFFKGCNLRCAWCHNPESQATPPELLFYSDRCTGCGACKSHCNSQNGSCTLCGNCALYCPTDARKLCGKEYTVEEVLEICLKDKCFYDASGGGVTLSGGECLLQADFAEELLRACKNHGIHTAVDTAGHLPFERVRQIMPYTDLFLYDVKCLDPEKHRRYVGVDNRLILHNLKELIEANQRIWVRIPVIASVNDSEEEIRSICTLLRSMGGVEQIELLPYHAMGEKKYTALGRVAETFAPPSEERMNQLKQIVKGEYHD